MKEHIKNISIVVVLLSGSGLLAQTVEVRNKTLGPVKVFLKGHTTGGQPYQTVNVLDQESITLIVDRGQLNLPAGESRYDLTAAKGVNTLIPTNLSFIAGECSGLSADNDALVVIEDSVAGGLKTNCTVSRAR